jgi:hypothetical protein
MIDTTTHRDSTRKVSQMPYIRGDAEMFDEIASEMPDLDMGGRPGDLFEYSPAEATFVPAALVCTAPFRRARDRKDHRRGGRPPAFARSKMKDAGGAGVLLVQGS